MRNRMKDLTPEELEEQKKYVQDATKRDTVNKTAAARAGAALGRANHGGPHPILVEDDQKSQQD
ncbi:hypothetical protein [Bifidobacterium animalis]|uniref:hypothetical protein n=1 Tax=Bifidobacterium animalis TaxID=28025 RepID=UPI001C3EDC59|nr:hypothetical protein [Bifidobacterium animalis]MCI6532621.1 hypothetical protein [Bifidobacterium animalis]MCR1995835.1 hypothetical protein [Bifidobacterium animalis subsp. animalis]MDY5041175.1 hypothetical protein [Bifidobacterium animalis]